MCNTARKVPASTCCACLPCGHCFFFCFAQVELPPLQPRGVLPLLQVGHVRVSPHLLRIHQRIQVHTRKPTYILTFRLKTKHSNRFSDNTYINTKKHTQFWACFCFLCFVAALLSSVCTLHRNRVISERLLSVMPSVFRCSPRENMYRNCRDVVVVFGSSCFDRPCA